MKSVVLIGDSIRMGYEATVKEGFSGSANVMSPKENGGNSENVLSHLDEWAISLSPDIVHINCGLHDLKREPGSDDAAIPLDTYRENVRQILSRLKSETKASVIWAATTPVNEKWHHDNKPFNRLEADLASYNQAATEVAEELGVAINDLFSVITNAGRDKYLSNDGVHFTGEGSALLGRAVVDFIKPYL